MYLATTLPPPEGIKNEVRDNVMGAVGDITAALLVTLVGVLLVNAIRK